MAAITRTWDTMASYPGDSVNVEVVEIPVAASTKICKGGFIIDNGSGFAINGTDTGGRVNWGVCQEEADNSSGGAGDILVKAIKNGTHLFKLASATVANLGAIAAIGADNDTVVSGTSNVDVGTIVAIMSDLFGTQAEAGNYVRVRITNYTV